MSEDELSDVRKAIDGIDGALIALLAQRLKEVDKVTAIKKKHGLAAAAPGRTEAVIAKVRAEAERAGFLPDVAEKMWRLLITEMIAYEKAHLKR